MKVCEMPYEHINLEEFEKSALEIINGVKNAKTTEAKELHGGGLFLRFYPKRTRKKDKFFPQKKER